MFFCGGAIYECSRFGVTFLPRSVQFSNKTHIHTFCNTAPIALLPKLCSILSPSKTHSRCPPHKCLSLTPLQPYLTMTTTFLYPTFAWYRPLPYPLNTHIHTHIYQHLFDIQHTHTHSLSFALSLPLSLYSAFPPPDTRPRKGPERPTL